VIAHKHFRHGNRCSCTLLAEAVHCKSDTVCFTFCREVLMKRWVVECNHGCHDETAPETQGSKWSDIGPIDSVKAVLISNR